MPAPRTTELRLDPEAPATPEFVMGLRAVGRLIAELTSAGGPPVTATAKETQAFLRVVKAIPGWPAFGPSPVKLAPLAPRGRK